MKYYLIAGEKSGDLHGSGLIRELARHDPQAQIRAWGGDRMAAAGATLFRHYSDLEVMGFTEVVRSLPAVLSALRSCKEDVINWQPDVLILIDYPGFNLRIASFAKKAGIPVYYYILPQLWAWHSSRVKKIGRNVDRLFTILPFEKEFYARYGLDAEYVGHPLLDVIEEQDEPLETIQSPKRVALLAGSRNQEIKKTLPVLAEVARLNPEMKFTLAGLKNKEKFYEEMAEYPNVEVRLDETYSVLRQSDAALVTSGTATLETALHGVPQVVIYRGGKINYWIGKRLVNVPYISLVNLILNKASVCELIQDELTAERLNYELHRLFEKDKREEIITDYRELKKLLGNKGASERTARKMIEYLKKENFKK